MGGGIGYAVQIDAFTDSPFKGNPAAVCLLEEEKDEEWMQKVACEFNLSQTAFLRKRQNTEELSQEFDLRWFTPMVEVDLCGHATLASAFFLFSSCNINCNSLFFHTRSGIISANRIDVVTEHGSDISKEGTDKFMVKVTLPRSSLIDCDSSVIAHLPNTLKGLSVLDVKKTSSNDIIIEVASGELIGVIKPDFEEIKKCDARGIIVTGCASEQSEFDFYSRVFFGKFGVDEDPVCGSAHCALAPYWSKKLSKRTVQAYQASRRGGKLQMENDDDKNCVALQGEAVHVMSGIITAL